MLDRADKEAAAPLPVRQHVHARSGEDRLSGPDAAAHRVDDRTRSKRKTGQIELGEAEMSDQLLEVADQDVRRIICRVVRLSARSVGAKVGHDHPEALGRDPGAVEEDDRPPLPRFVIGELDAVGGRPAMNCGLVHGKCSQMFTLTYAREEPAQCLIRGSFT